MSNCIRLILNKCYFRVILNKIIVTFEPAFGLEEELSKK